LPEPVPRELKARKAPSKIKLKKLLKRERCHIDGNMEHNFLNDLWTEIENSSKTSNKGRQKKKKKESG
jgi:hypothetical protein